MANLKVTSKKIDISIVVCTYNSPKLIERCVKSILKQEIDKKIEILLVDGRSNLSTMKLLKKFEKENEEIRIISNPEKLPEGYGKGKIFGIIDQDNELIGKDCLKNLMKPFEEKDIFGVACRLYMKKKDNLANQVVSLIGTDAVTAYRSLDFLIHTNKLNLQDKGDYEVLKLKKDNLIVTGGNCFFYRKSALEKIGGYVQDVDNLLELIKKGENKIAISKKAFTHHQAIGSFFEFLKKKKKWGREYTERKREFSWMPKTKLERREFIVNFFGIVFLFPILLEGFMMVYKTKKLQALFLPVMKLANAVAYSSGKIRI